LCPALGACCASPNMVQEVGKSHCNSRSSHYSQYLFVSPRRFLPTVWIEEMGNGDSLVLVYGG
jgi:hypothetical protein